MKANPKRSPKNTSAREDRVAEALRENLRKRKAQGHARDAENTTSKDKKQCP
jgi:hypothetical protein